MSQNEIGIESVDTESDAQKYKEHLLAAFPGRRIFIHLERKPDGNTLLLVFDYDRSENYPVYAVSIMSRDMLLVAYGDPMLVPMLTGDEYLALSEGGEVPPDYKVADYK